VSSVSVGWELEHYGRGQPEEEYRLMSADIPIPATNPVVPLSTIFWNGEAEPLNPNGKTNIPSPDAAGAAKTITITNYDTDTIYPFLRTENSGQDPNDSNEGPYDPQDLPLKEFRLYVGYTKSAGSKYLGLPSGASITFQVPLVLWDGNNISLVTDGTYLTTPKGAPGSTLFGYDATAKISIAVSDETVSNSIWVQDSSNYPTGQSPLIMFYFTDTPATVSDDAPSQPAEVTFRDPYLKYFIDDDFQTFPLINYDVTNVNKLAAPASMEASNVPITSGAVQSGNLKYYPPNEDFGWHGSDKDMTTFGPPLVNFVNNTGDASIGAYFGGKGWPTFYNPNNDEINIPSGANLFDLSPLDVNGTVVHTSNFDSNRWILSSSGGGAIQAMASGVSLTDPDATRLPLNFISQAQREVFITDIASMKASDQPIDLTISTDDPNFKGVLGSLVDYDPSSSVRAYNKVAGGSGYSQQTFAKIVSVNGEGEGAQGDVHVVNGVVVSIGLNPDHAGSGYTAPPSVEITDPTGQGAGAEYFADITGGTAIVELAGGRTLPTGTNVTYVFKRTATDYAAIAITNLWYSWAQYYADLFKDYAPQSAQGTLVHKSIGNGPPLLTNEITLDSPPQVPLAMGMTVMADNGIPAGTTILGIDGTTVYLSQIPDADTPMIQQYTFGKPAGFSIDATSAQYTEPYTLTFSLGDQLNAKLFAGSVYESMQVQSVALPNSEYLPTTMNLVAHVIKFWANLPTYDENAWGTVLVGEARDIAKSILRGVYDYYQVPDQSKWYPNPNTPTGGQLFNVFNLNPYVWFVHNVEGLDGYAFSIDDDVANPSATGPRGDVSNHFPNNLQIGFAGIKGTGSLSDAKPLGNQKEWFPTTKWGSIETTATIGVWQGPGAPQYNGFSFITLTGPDAIRTLNTFITPGPGQVGALISAPEFIVPGTTLIFFPNGVSDPKNPTIILSQNAISTTASIPVTIDAAQMTIPGVRHSRKFATPIQTGPATPAN
jgi:hypothetical protein